MADDVRKKIMEEDDWIYCPRFNNSISCLLDRYPDGVPERIIAQVLLITEEEVEALYQGIVLKLREALREDED